MTSKALQQMVTDFAEGIEIQDRTWRFQTYRRCFVASEAVDWLLDSGHAESRADAVQKGNLLLFHKIFQHVSNPQPFKDAYLFFSLRPDVHVYSGYGRMLVRFIKGVELKDRWYRFWKYRKCFSGRDAVAWLLENGHASDLKEALKLGQTMINHCVFVEYRGYRAEFRTSDSVYVVFEREAREFQLYQFRYCFRENIKHITQITRIINITINSLKHQLANVHTRISQTTQLALRARTQVPYHCFREKRIFNPLSILASFFSQIWVFRV